MQKKKQKLHSAKDVLYCPAIQNNVTEKVENCSVYKYKKPRQQTEPPMNHHLPNARWQVDRIDLFKHSGHHYIVLGDDYSFYNEVPRL